MPRVVVAGRRPVRIGHKTKIGLSTGSVRDGVARLESGADWCRVLGSAWARGRCRSCTQGESKTCSGWAGCLRAARACCSEEPGGGRFQVQGVAES